MLPAGLVKVNVVFNGIITLFLARAAMLPLLADRLGATNPVGVTVISFVTPTSFDKADGYRFHYRIRIVFLFDNDLTACSRVLCRNIEPRGIAAPLGSSCYRKNTINADLGITAIGSRYTQIVGGNGRTDHLHSIIRIPVVIQIVHYPQSACAEGIGGEGIQLFRTRIRDCSRKHDAFSRITDLAAAQR